MRVNFLSQMYFTREEQFHAWDLAWIITRSFIWDSLYTVLSKSFKMSSWLDISYNEWEIRNGQFRHVAESEWSLKLLFIVFDIELGPFSTPTCAGGRRSGTTSGSAWKRPIRAAASSVKSARGSTATSSCRTPNEVRKSEYTRCGVTLLNGFRWLNLLFPLFS